MSARQVADESARHGDVLSRHLKGHGDNDKAHKNASKLTRVRLQERQHGPESPTGNTVVVWPLGSASSPSRSSRHSPQQPGLDEAPSGTNSAPNNATVSSIDTLDPDIVIPNAREIPVAPNLEPSAQADLGSLDQQTASPTPSHGARRSEKPPLSHEIQNRITLGRSKPTPRVGQEDDEMQALFSFSYSMPPISETSIADHELSNTMAHSQAEPDVLMSNSVDSAAHLSIPDETQPTTTFRRDSLHGHDTSALSDQDLGHLLGQYVDRTWPPAEPDWLPGLDTELTIPDLNWRSWGNNPLLSFDVTAPLDHPIKRRRKTASFTSEIPDERFAEMAKLWPKRGDQPWQLMQTLWSDSVTHRGSNLFSDTKHAGDSYVATGPKSAEGRLDDQRRMSMSQEYGVECPSVVIPAQKHE
ncbi:Fungal-trans domain-containing protein [Fusarium falciforme]|uniref:Fungal-trans domain-containing protein n=1 Tax=Fusarium falciforme TaxID=195108 RepID=UPI0023004669|nr:Fungal-trans domain-containing protein [Fusarium falciforme]WAO91260.1 Fungal-trans domain-containing protein [Fusarium falciforme]